jgi:plasmid stabilization system protein ParE
LKVRFLASARGELEAAARHYRERNPSAAVAFRRDVMRAVTWVSAQPLAWPVFGADSRRCLCSRFPYGLIYRVHGDTVVVLAVAHTRRKPGYWEQSTP